MAVKTDRDTHMKVDTLVSEQPQWCSYYETNVRLLFYSVLHRIMRERVGYVKVEEPTSLAVDSKLHSC